MADDTGGMTAPTTPDRSSNASTSDDAATIVATLRRAVRAPWTILITTAVGVITLAMLRVSGSSIAMIGASSPWGGRARPIRSDEYVLRTPLVVRQSRLGFPERTTIGLGEHATGLLTDLPTNSPLRILRPQTVGYGILDVERAFALEWWFVLAAPGLAVCWVVFSITHRTALAAAAGAAVVVAPAVLWWPIPPTGMSIAFAATCCAALVHAGRATRPWQQVAFGTIAGWSLAGLATVLYLPWTIPMAVVFVPLGLTLWWRARRDAHGPAVPWWWSIVPFAVVAAGLTFAFVATHADALDAIRSTVYPGARREPAGGVDPSLVFSAPFDVFATGPRDALVNGTNQSEAAAGLALWLPLLLAGGVWWRWRRSADPVRLATTVTAVATTILLCWAFLPVPAVVGRVSLLDQVPVERLLLPLAVAGVLLLAFASAAPRDDVDGGARRSRAITGVVVAAGVIGWAGVAMRVDGAPVDRLGVTVLTVITAVVFALAISGRGVATLVAVVALSLFSTARINPVQVGLDPLLDAPLMRQVERLDPVLDDDPDAPRWLLDGNDPTATAVMTASGVPLVSGLAWYPLPEPWAVLDPEGDDEAVWNRYARVEFSLTPDDARAVLDAPFPDVVTVTVGVCAAQLTELGVDVVVTAQPLDVPCVRPLGAAPTTPGELLIYERVG